jgi:uncharacterized membrane protein
MTKSILGSFALVMVATLALAAGSVFVFKPIASAPNSSPNGTAPNDVNSAKWVVGFYQSVVDGLDHGYAQKGKDFKNIEPPKVLGSYLSGINDQGTMVGGYCDTVVCNPRNAQHGYLYESGRYTRFDYPTAGTTIVPEGINNLGEVVGGYCPGLFSCPEGSLPSAHAFLLKRGVYTTLDFPSATATQAYGINDSGSIVGSYLDSVLAGHAYLYQGGVFSKLDFPNALWTVAVSINNSGTVSGYFADTKAIVHGFIYQNGKFNRIDVPGAFSTALGGVSNSGDVTATATIGDTGSTFMGVPTQ